MSNLYFRPIVFFENLNFYFMKTTKIPVYGNMAVYGNIALSVYKTDYKLRCLEYMFFYSVSSIKTPRALVGLRDLNREDTDNLRTAIASLTIDQVIHIYIKPTIEVKLFFFRLLSN